MAGPETRVARFAGFSGNIDTGHYRAAFSEMRMVLGFFLTREVVQAARG